MSQQRIPIPQFGNPLLRMNGRCPVCNTGYDFQGLRVLAERDQSILAYLECNNCATAVLSYLHISGMGLSNQALVTDLTPEEVYERLDQGEVVDSDELIHLHTYLENDIQLADLLDEVNN